MHYVPIGKRLTCHMASKDLESNVHVCVMAGIWTLAGNWLGGWLAWLLLLLLPECRTYKQGLSTARTKCNLNKRPNLSLENHQSVVMHDNMSVEKLICLCILWISCISAAGQYYTHVNMLPMGTEHSNFVSLQLVNKMWLKSCCCIQYAKYCHTFCIQVRQYCYLCKVALIWPSRLTGR